MIEGRNIAFQSTLSEIAIELSDQYPGLIDLVQFNNDLVSGEGKDAFVADLQEVQRLSITRLPSLVFRRQGRQALISSGYKPYESLLGIVEELVPELK
jgi:predicted DsbA family dithiol-disulfide isomerase